MGMKIISSKSHQAGVPMKRVSHIPRLFFLFHDVDFSWFRLLRCPRPFSLSRSSSLISPATHAFTVDDASYKRITPESLSSRSRLPECISSIFLDNGKPTIRPSHHRGGADSLIMIMYLFCLGTVWDPGGLLKTMAHMSPLTPLSCP